DRGGSRVQVRERPTITPGSGSQTAELRLSKKRSLLCPDQLSPARREAAECRLWVRAGKPHREQFSSASLSIADIVQISDQVSLGPNFRSLTWGRRRWPSAMPPELRPRDPAAQALPQASGMPTGGEGKSGSSLSRLVVLAERWLLKAVKAIYHR